MFRKELHQRYTTTATTKQQQQQNNSSNRHSFTANCGGSCDWHFPLLKNYFIHILLLPTIYPFQSLSLFNYLSLSHMYLPTHTHTHSHTHTHTYTHTLTYTHLHTHTYIHAQNDHRHFTFPIVQVQGRMKLQSRGNIIKNFNLCFSRALQISNKESLNQQKHLFRLPQVFSLHLLICMYVHS